MTPEILVFAAESVVSDASRARAIGGVLFAGLADDSPAEDLPFAGARRMARVSRLALAAGTAALAAAGVAVGEQRDRLALTFCSAFGALDHTESFYRQVLGYDGPYPSPSLFAESVINAPAGHLSIGLGIRGSVRTLAVGRGNGLPALCQVLEDIEAGDPGAVLFVAADSPSPFCLDVLGRCERPFARALGEGVAAGEGAVALLLGANGALPAPPLARITWFDTRQTPADAAAALLRLAWPAAVPSLARPSSAATLARGIEERALRSRWPAVELATVVAETGFLFGAHGALEVAAAARSLAAGGAERAELVTGVDLLGTASVVQIATLAR